MSTADRIYLTAQANIGGNEWSFYGARTAKRNSNVCFGHFENKCNLFVYEKFVRFCKEDIFNLMKLVLLEKKIIVFSRIPNNATIFVMNLVSLFPGNILFNYK